MIKLYAQALQENLYESEEKKEAAIQGVIKNAKQIERYVTDIVKVSKDDLFVIQVKEEIFELEDIMKALRQTYEEKCKKLYVELLGSIIIRP